jgi:hypothetical protein
VEELLVSAFELKVFPNPAQQSVNLGFTSLSIEPYDILLLNEAGHVVVQKRGTTAIGNNQIDFNLEILSAGSYHFLVKVGNAMANEGFIKVE